MLGRQGSAAWGGASSSSRCDVSLMPPLSTAAAEYSANQDSTGTLRSSSRLGRQPGALTAPMSRLMNAGASTGVLKCTVRWSPLHSPTDASAVSVCRCLGARIRDYLPHVSPNSPALHAAVQAACHSSCMDTGMCRQQCRQPGQGGARCAALDASAPTWVIVQRLVVGPQEGIAPVKQVEQALSRWTRGGQHARSGVGRRWRQRRQ